MSGGARLWLGASVVALFSVAHFNRYSGPALDQLALAHPIPEGKDHAGQPNPTHQARDAFLLRQADAFLFRR
jgi:hypothetical protein